MKRYLALILALCMTLALAACGGGGGGEDEGSTGAIPTESIFRFSQVSMPNIDPACGSDLAATNVFTNVYDPLLFPTADGGVEPWIAESYEPSEDGLSWTFHIRQGIKFHSGNDLTAKDVKYSMDRLCTIGEGVAYMFYDYIKEVEVVDDYTVVFHCNEVYGPLIANLMVFYVLDSELVKANTVDNGDYGENGDYGKGFLLTTDAGSGPYRITEISTNISISGEKFADYWAGTPEEAPEKFVLYASNDAVTVKTMMFRRELEAADSYQSAENIKSMLEGDETFKLAYNYTGGGVNLWMNNQKAPFDDPKVREAFGYLFDYDTLCTIIQPDSAVKKSIVPSGKLGWTPVFDFSYDLEKAKACLAESKYADTIGDMEIEFVWNSETAEREKIALMAQAAGQQIGLNIKIVELPWSTIVANATSCETSPMVTLCQVTPLTGDVASMLVSMLRTKEVGTWENMNWVNDPALDELINKALVTLDQDERAKIYEEIQEYCGKNFTFIPLTETPERIVYQASYVEMNPRISASGYTFYLREIKVHPAQQ